MMGFLICAKLKYEDLGLLGC